jgi:hypothetical protein
VGFLERAVHFTGRSTRINEALGEHLANAGTPLDETTLRRIIREELKKVS